MTLVESAWQISAEDLSRLESGKVEEVSYQVLRCNVGSILAETQHSRHFNYLTTPLCEKQGRWRARPRDRQEERDKHEEFVW